MKVFLIFKANGLSPEDPLRKTLREELTICLSSLNVDVLLNFFTDKGLLTGTHRPEFSDISGTFIETLALNLKAN